MYQFMARCAALALLTCLLALPAAMVDCTVNCTGSSGPCAGVSAQVSITCGGGACSGTVTVNGNGGSAQQQFSHPSSGTQGVSVCVGGAQRCCVTVAPCSASTWSDVAS